jgi:hypothetical protein
MRTRSINPSYGSRGRLRGTDSGIRRVAPTFGKARISAYSEKAGGHFAVESLAERFVADVLNLDPRVRSFSCQPFTLDLVEGRILRTAEERASARRRHEHLPSPRSYTPDILAVLSGDQDLVVEVKLQGYLGDYIDDRRLTLARELLHSAGYRFLRVVVPKDAWFPLRLNLGPLSLAASRPELLPGPDLAAALTHACGEGGSSLGSICRSLGLAASHTPGWLVGGVFAADLLRQPINFDMQVTCAHGDRSHLSLIEELAA